MLKKLLKYEFRATARTFLLCYGGLLLLSILVGISVASSFAPPYGGNDILMALLFTAYICLLAGIFVFTFINILQRFYKNLLGGEGYLMNTLPVKAWQLVASKLIAGTFWYLASFLAAGLSLVLIVLMTDVSILGELMRELSGLPALLEEELSVDLALFGAQAALLGLLDLVTSLCLLYVSCMVGHQFNRHRVAASVLAYFFISLGVSTITDFLALAGMENFSTALPETPLVFSSVWNGAFWSSVLVQLVLFAVYFGATTHFLEKRLNLE